MNSPPPVSLGKPSLRHRLESYYSLIAPSAIADKEKWKNNFEIIYQKYGGTVEGETKLAAKLAKKYGTRVRLLVAPPHRSMQWKLHKSGSNNNTVTFTLGSKREESYYGIDESRRDSKVLDFMSPRFDAVYALNDASEGKVVEENPSFFNLPFAQHTKLDNISKFRALLPEGDPQRLEPRNTVPKMQKSEASNAKAEVQKKTPMFLALASRYESKSAGPLCLLYSIVANRQRARVMVRYVDCIRGTLTGYLIAFDKHFNMILKDVDEVYSGRVTRHPQAVEVAKGRGSDKQCSDCGPSKPKLEAQRRRCYPPDGSGGPGPAIKQRYFHQLMVRGDNVVMVWRAEAERSAHPRANTNPLLSKYESRDLAKDSGSYEEIGTPTPGSLYYALQRWTSQSRPR
ncbi:hypothetical protein ACHAWF_001524 [Thalassiosira exigua]